MAEQKKQYDFSKFHGAISQPIGASPPSPTRQIAIIGASGSGKTTWAALAEDALIILLESQAEGRVREANPNARLVKVDSADMLRECYAWLSRDLFATDDKSAFKNPWVPKIVVLDGGTEAFKMVADDLGGEDDQWDWNTWRIYDDKCTRLIRLFRDLPCTFLCTFLDEVDRGGEGSGAPARRMKVGKKSMAPGIAALFDLVFWSDTKDKGDDGIEYVIRTTGGAFRGHWLEQGKGHPSLEKWLLASEYPPTRVVQVCNDYADKRVAEVMGKPGSPPPPTAAPKEKPPAEQPAEGEQAKGDDDKKTSNRRLGKGRNKE